MINTYTFSIINGHIICDIIKNSNVYKFDGFKAENQLRKMDRIKYNKIRASKKMLKLYSDNMNVVIKDVDEFNSLNLLDKYFKNTLPQIKKAIILYQISRKTNQIAKNIQLNGKKVAVGTLACSLLLSAYNVNKLVNNKKDIDTEDLTDDLENKIVDNTLLENDDVKVIDTTATSIKNSVNNTISLDIECKYNSAEYSYVRDNYGELIDRYANKWGMSPSMITAIMAQESAGRNPNLMNILFDSWKDTIINVYNYEDNCYTKLVLTENSSNYDSDVICINRQELMNKNTNISFGCAIMAYNLKYYDYNIPLAITSYNCGIGGVNNILKLTANQTGTTVDSIIQDPSNSSFLDYTYAIDKNYGGDGGDTNYLKHVLRYVENKDDALYAIDQDNVYNLTVDFQKVSSISI